MSRTNILALAQQTKALAEKATPGPWDVSSEPHPRRVLYEGDGEIADCHAYGDTDFIAHARTAAPQLADAVVSLTAQLAALQAENERLKNTSELVNRFLAWSLPKTVCSDLCVTEKDYPHRVGTNLLTADEARQMFEYVLGVTEARETSDMSEANTEGGE